MVELGIAPDVLTPEQQGIENAKQSVLAIERFCFALNKISIPLNAAEPILQGFSMLQQMHDKLLEQIGPDEVAKLRAQVNQQTPPQAGLVKPDGTPA